LGAIEERNLKEWLPVYSRALQDLSDTDGAHAGGVENDVELFRKRRRRSLALGCQMLLIVVIQ
jgi:hypothetical protein